jgi:Cu2+-exporting ATPase
MKQLVLAFSVPYVTCQSCIQSIRTIVTGSFQTKFDSFELLDYFQYDLEKKIIQLKVNVFDEQMSEHAIAAELMSILASDLEDIGQEINVISPPQYQHYLGFIFSFMAGLFWLSLSLGIWVLAPWVYPVAVGVSLVLLSILAKDFFHHAFFQLQAGFKNKTVPFFNMDSLFVLTGMVVILSTLLSLYFPIFPNLLEAGFLIFGFRHLGILFQSYLDKKLGFSRSLVDMFQFRKYSLKDGGEKVSAKDLKKGQKILIQKGDILPIDGIIISKSQDLEMQDMLANGSYLPFYPQACQKILAGMECMQGDCVVEVTHDLVHCRLQDIDSSVLKIGNKEKKAAISNKIEKWLQWFIPAVLMISVVSFIVISQFFPIAMALQCAIAVLVSACPCTLGLIIPMALRMGAYKASVHQTHFQSSGALQKASEAKVLVMDYNGTLSKGEIHVADFQRISPSLNIPHALQVIYTIEKEMLKHRPSQLLGGKIKAYVESLGHKTHVEGQCEDLGCGGKLITEQGTYFFGNNQLLNNLMISGGERLPQRLYLIHQAFETMEYELMGYLDCNDPPREEARSFVHHMIDQGKTVKICTGADEQTAKYIANILDIAEESISSNNRMPDKKQYLQKLRTQYPSEAIVMIGDAINDKAAFQECDLSIFLLNPNNASDMSKDLKNSVDILSYSGSLMEIAEAFKIADETFYVIKQNLYISFVYNFASLLLAAGVLLAIGVSMHPVIGVTLMIIQSILLMLNAYRLMFSHHNLPDAELANRQALTAT